MPFTRRTADDEAPPILPTLAETYLAITKLCQPAIGTLLRTLADPDNLPVIIFCAAGKDRTGVATALVLGSLNVGDDVIVEDYARSGIIDLRSLGDLYAQHMAGMPDSHQGSAPENMQRFLSEIRREFGSIREFVARCGFGAERLISLERALLTAEVVDQPMRPVT